MSKKLKKDVEFLYEMGALRLIPRQWSRFHTPLFQNLTEHHYRVLWLALTIAAREGKKVDTEKIMKMALVHDIPESRTGDVDYLARQYVARHEDRALADMLSGTSLSEEFVALWNEYEKRDSLEAKIVKDADNLDVDMELREQGANGSAVEKVFKPNRLRVREAKLYTKSAKEIFDALYESDPHDWHSQSPNNRLNGGDWKK